MQRHQSVRSGLRACLQAGAIAVPLCVSASALAGPDWTEVGDAGFNLGTAQVPFGTAGVLNTITGALSGSNLLPDFEDCYLIRIIDPVNFSISITTSDFNAQLFLFNITVTNQAYGLLANDDRSISDFRPLLTGMSTDGPGPVVVPAVGDYMLAVTGFNRDPVSISGPIFDQMTTTEISRADGIGGLNPHIDWTGEGETGNYIITATGITFPQLPAPGTLPLLAAAGVFAARRRR
ncbi:MAG: hypothetical protein KF745_02590 [Phycisphaeraceae bacterium]|nr:hypothetical protein [Phycisphaeraceae bacterium]